VLRVIFQKKSGSLQFLFVPSFRGTQFRTSVTLIYETNFQWNYYFP